MALDVTIWGGIVSILLLVNAFFIKDLVKVINEMRISLVIVTTQHDGTIKDVDAIKNKMLLMEKEEIKMRERLHSLEGGQLQVLAFMEEHYRKIK